MRKVSARQVHQVLACVPDALTKLAAERDYWRHEAQTRIRHDRATKVACEMHNKGIEQHVPLADLVDRMEKAAERGELNDIARAVSMVGPDMGMKIAHLASGIRDDDGSSISANALTQYLLGGIG